MGRSINCVKCGELAEANRSYCKPCEASRKREQYKKSLDGKYRLYRLPCGYIGRTNNIKWRAQVQNRRGMDYSNAKILFTSKNPKLILFLEAFLHLIGFKGSQYDGKTK